MRVILGQFRQIVMQQGQLLAQPVMQIAGDLQPFGLTFFHQTTKKIVDACLRDASRRDIIADADQMGGAPLTRVALEASQTSSDAWPGRGRSIGNSIAA